MRENAVQARNVTVTWLPQVKRGENAIGPSPCAGQKGAIPDRFQARCESALKANTGALMKRVVTHHRSLFFISNFPEFEPLGGAPADALSAAETNSTRALPDSQQA
ncbi:hypothetical protein [Dongia sp.]|uniref:hypothetical protein n=1 Tax=Dongia sp. TaxID=1977262 RepID=UPI0035AF047A